MNRYAGLLLLSFVLVSSIAPARGAMDASASPAGTPGVTVAVVPARYSVLQVGFDLANRHRVVLVSYQGEAKSEKPVIHAWSGVEWIPVSVEDYKSGAFLRKKAERVMLVGSELDVPEVIAEGSSWCPSVLNISGLDTASLVTGFGRVLGFSPDEWNWFAARYNLKIADSRPKEQKQSWYDQPLQIDDKTPALVRWIRGGSKGSENGNKVEIRKNEEPAPVPVIDDTKVEIKSPAPGASEPAVIQAPVPGQEPMPAEPKPAAPADAGIK
jgi:hypothetical protein